IEEKYSTTPYGGNIGGGEIRRFADSTRFHLRSAYSISDVLLLGEGPDQEEIDRLLKRLETGLPAEGLFLLDLPIRLSRGARLALVNAGIKNLEDLKKLTDDELRQFANAAQVKQIQLMSEQERG